MSYQRSKGFNVSKSDLNRNNQRTVFAVAEEEEFYVITNIFTGIDGVYIRTGLINVMWPLLTCVHQNAYPFLNTTVKFRMY
jgi:hypothetical protein